jgi:hypothetical protein
LAPKGNSIEWLEQQVERERQALLPIERARETEAISRHISSTRLDPYERIARDEIPLLP